jgi:predicted nucleic acid-binding Zn ribbon protein
MKRNRHPTTGGITKIGDVIPQLIVRYGLHRPQNLEQIEEAWRQAVGEQYAHITHVSKLYRGTLTIKVPHNAFMQELSFRQSELLDTLAMLLIDEKIKKIRYEI